jgi:endonuclease/exonuclease/phosphatase family metal-dependent hydrolase
MALPRLKLRVADAEDLEAIAACLQDALVAVGDMAWLPREKRFVMLVNRFCWECGAAQDPALPSDDTAPVVETADAGFVDPAGSEPPFTRIHAALTFEGVRAVRLRGIDRRFRSRVLELLTIALEDDRVTLVFADHAAVELTVDRLRARLADLGENWPTRWRPHHPVEADAGGGGGRGPR